MPTDPISARVILEQHQGGGPLPPEDEELLARWQRATSDPLVTKQQRRALRLEIECHPVLHRASC
jgi:hypothetical protein